jgi:alkanesulfonate monooxygenase SsuD/methylene tetrahydromethanopterin reductase-like flavin-dependent oxidoreductase (luciferase family)
MERIVDACVPHGTPEQVAARFAEYRDAGAETVVVAPAVPAEGRERLLDLLAGDVLPRLRG